MGSIIKFVDLTPLDGHDSPLPKLHHQNGALNRLTMNASEARSAEVTKSFLALSSILNWLSA